jgi:hypothetical protein
MLWDGKLASYHQVAVYTFLMSIVCKVSHDADISIPVQYQKWPSRGNCTSWSPCRHSARHEKGNDDSWGECDFEKEDQYDFVKEDQYDFEKEDRSAWRNDHISDDQADAERKGGRE